MKTAFRNLIFRTLRRCVGVLLCLELGVPAANYTVEMTSSLEFSPSYLEIEAGDTVTWVNRDGQDSHDCVCNGVWNSGDIYETETFARLFPVTGTFDYYDSLYAAVGMTGRIVVKPASAPQPAVLIDPQVLANGSFRCTVSNLVIGKTYVIEASTNLVSWTGMVTNVAAAEWEEYVDAEAPAFRGRCYRTRHLP